MYTVGIFLALFFFLSVICFPFQRILPTVLILKRDSVLLFGRPESHMPIASPSMRQSIGGKPIESQRSSIARLQGSAQLQKRGLGDQEGLPNHVKRPHETPVFGTPDNADLHTLRRATKQMQQTPLSPQHQPHHPQQKQPDPQQKQPHPQQRQFKHQPLGIVYAEPKFEQQRKAGGVQTQNSSATANPRTGARERPCNESDTGRTRTGLETGLEKEDSPSQVGRRFTAAESGLGSAYARSKPAAAAARSLAKSAMERRRPGLEAEAGPSQVGRHVAAAESGLGAAYTRNTAASGSPIHEE